jgi:hypothetical protein
MDIPSEGEAMQRKTMQSGMSMWGFMVVVVLAVFFLFLFFKLLPPYLEFFKVKTSLENVAQQSNAANMTRMDVANALDRRFSIEDITRVDVKKDLKIEKAPSGRTLIRIQYQVIVPLAYNVSALLDFDHGVESAAARVD